MTGWLLGECRGIGHWVGLDQRSQSLAPTTTLESDSTWNTRAAHLALVAQGPERGLEREKGAVVSTGFYKTTVYCVLVPEIRGLEGASLS